MNIGLIGNTVSQAVRQASAAQPSLAASSGVEPTDMRGADTSFSGPAQQLSKLKALQASDPEKFKTVMSSISDELNTAAQSSTDPGEQKALSELASKFKTAAETGDLSSLAPGQGTGGTHAAGPPPGGAPPGGGPPPGGGKPSGGGKSASSAGESSSSTKVPDPADTNGDGKVSAKERQDYDAKQAAAKEAMNPKAQRAYGQQAHGPGEFGQVMSKISSIIDQALGSVSGAQQS